VEPSAEAASAAEAAEVVLPLTFGDIFVQSPAVRWCLLHNCEVESLAVMRQLCSTFMRDVPRVINSKDWQLKHRCVILNKEFSCFILLNMEFSRKQCMTLYRRDPQEAGWLAIITGSDMARPDLLMRQLASGMASSRVYSFFWTNFEDSPDSSRLDSSYGKAKKCHPHPHAPPRDIAGGFDAGGGARGGGSGSGGGGSVFDLLHAPMATPRKGAPDSLRRESLGRISERSPSLLPPMQPNIDQRTNLRGGRSSETPETPSSAGVATTPLMSNVTTPDNSTADVTA
jgi:hypothetical protein